jgi:osomolarity two-component system sensor histidine kinase TcsA
MPQESIPAATAEPDVGFIFNLSPLALLVLSPSWRITKASSRILEKWRVAADDCVGQELLRFVETQMRPSRPAHLARLTTTINDAIAAHAERTTKAINTGDGIFWRARVIPIFNSDELLSIILEWHEASPDHLEAEGLRHLSPQR